MVLTSSQAQAADGVKPNILWITCEDMSPDLGCYGDAYARSPNIDRFAAEGVRYTHVFSHAGVCAPSRSGIITGMYPCSIGSQNMRSRITLPPEVKCFTEYLRAAGYYCTNNAKTDYNFETPAGAWDANGKNAHWRNRPKDRPFFAVFNLQVTHESQIRAPEDVYQKNTARLTPEQRHDPAAAKLPPYYPDTPVVRRDWARYHDNITAMDYQFADLLKELDDADLADDTIVFFYSDHGRGLPRGKRWLYDSGTRVPLVVRWPEKLRDSATKSETLKPGLANDELVAFVDLAPTVLSIAGVEIPKHLQGQPFLGAARADKPREFVYGARDRMDERVDLIRAVRDKRFKYLRNYEWWKPYAQNISYMNEMPTMQELRRLAGQGKLDAAQQHFMAATKPHEELYDCEADPHELKNLAGDPAHADTLTRLRDAHERWTEDIFDLGYLPEVTLAALQRKGSDWRAKLRTGRIPLTIQNFWRIPVMPDVSRNVNAAGQAHSLFSVTAADDPAATGTALKIRGAQLLTAAWRDIPNVQSQLKSLLAERNIALRIAAAQSFVALDRNPHDLTRIPDDAETLAIVKPIYTEGLRHSDPVVRHMAASAVDELGPQAVQFLPEIEAMLKIDKDYAARVGEFIVATRKK